MSGSGERDVVPPQETVFKLQSLCTSGSAGRGGGSVPGTQAYNGAVRHDQAAHSATNVGPSSSKDLKDTEEIVPRAAEVSKEDELPPDVRGGARETSTSASSALPSSRTHTATPSPAPTGSGPVPLSSKYPGISGFGARGAPDSVPSKKVAVGGRSSSSLQRSASIDSGGAAVTRSHSAWPRPQSSSTATNPARPTSASSNRSANNPGSVQSPAPVPGKVGKAATESAADSSGVKKSLTRSVDSTVNGKFRDVPNSVASSTTSSAIAAEAMLALQRMKQRETDTQLKKSKNTAAPAPMSAPRHAQLSTSFGSPGVEGGGSRSGEVGEGQGGGGWIQGTKHFTSLPAGHNVDKVVMTDSDAHHQRFSSESDVISVSSSRAVTRERVADIAEGGHQNRVESEVGGVHSVSSLPDTPMKDMGQQQQPQETQLTIQSRHMADESAATSVSSDRVGPRQFEEVDEDEDDGDLQNLASLDTVIRIRRNNSNDGAAERYAAARERFLQPKRKSVGQEDAVPGSVDSVSQGTHDAFIGPVEGLGDDHATASAQTTLSKRSDAIPTRIGNASADMESAAGIDEADGQAKVIDEAQNISPRLDVTLVGQSEETRRVSIKDRVQGGEGDVRVVAKSIFQASKESDAELLRRTLEATSASKLRYQDHKLLFTDQDGCTPFHYACKAGNLELVKLLVEALGCDVAVKDVNGWTGLQYACKGFHMTVVKYIVENCSQKQA